MNYKTSKYLKQVLVATLKKVTLVLRRFAISPRDELVHGVKFAIGMTVCLSGIEIAHMAFLHSWNSEVFTATSSLIGLVTGIFISHHA